MKKLFFCSLFLVFSFNAVACPHATPANSPEFCESFREAGHCHCTSSGLPSGMCSDMKLLFQRMMDMFGSLERTCEFQSNTSKENCIESWNCFLYGGVDMQGNPCSGNGQPCQ